jgi:hypothetical protein
MKTAVALALCLCAAAAASDDYEMFCGCDDWLGDEFAPTDWNGITCAMQAQAIRRDFPGVAPVLANGDCATLSSADVGQVAFAAQSCCASAIPACASTSTCPTPEPTPAAALGSDAAAARGPLLATAVLGAAAAL